MALYRVVVEQKITKKVIVVVEANSDKEAMDKARSRDIIADETSLDFRIDEFIPLEAEKY